MKDQMVKCVDFDYNLQNILFRVNDQVVESVVYNSFTE